MATTKKTANIVEETESIEEKREPFAFGYTGELTLVNTVDLSHAFTAKAGREDTVEVGPSVVRDSDPKGSPGPEVSFAGYRVDKWDNGSKINLVQLVASGQVRVPQEAARLAIQAMAPAEWKRVSERIAARDAKLAKLKLLEASHFEADRLRAELAAGA